MGRKDGFERSPLPRRRNPGHSARLRSTATAAQRAVPAPRKGASDLLGRENRAQGSVPGPHLPPCARCDCPHSCPVLPQKSAD